MRVRALLVVSVPAEADALLAAFPAEGPAEALPGGYRLRRADTGALRADVLTAGVGPAAAAAATATALTVAALPPGGRPYDVVLSAGIAGGFPPLAPGTAVVAARVVAADLGAQTADGFASVADLGFGTVEYEPPPALLAALAQATGAVCGPVLTVSTATGSAVRAAELAARHPGAAAEAMEGAGVAQAAAAHGVPVLELRAVSNTVGPRDRAAWRIPQALAALTDAVRAALPALEALETGGDRV